MRYKKFLAVFLSTLVISGISAKSESVIAAPQIGEVIIQSINGKDEGIFSEKDGLWQPGMKKTNEFIIINNSDSDIQIKDFNIENDISKDTLEYIEFSKRANIGIWDNGQLIYKNNLINIATDKGITLDNVIEIEKGKEKTLEMSVEILPSMNNTSNIIMDLEVEFSLAMTYEVAGLGTNEGSEDKPELPQTGTLVNGFTKGIFGVATLLSGVCMVNKSKKKEDEAND